MKMFAVAALALLALLVGADPLWAAEGATFLGTPSAAAGFGAGLIMLGAGIGFGKIGGAALESTARQPEMAGRIFTAMLIIGALLEGAAFFALLICFTMAGR